MTALQRLIQYARGLAAAGLDIEVILKKLNIKRYKKNILKMSKDELLKEFGKSSKNINKFISVVTEFELYSGAVNSEKEKDILNILAAIKTLPFSSESAYEASKIYKFLKQHNQIIEIGDIFIGATGLAYNMPLLTNNIKHFKRIEGLLLLKP